MFSRDQVLSLMRERVHHPAGMRELLQVLKVPKDDQTSFKRHVKSLVAAGAIADTTTVVRARAAGLSPGEYLSDNDAYAFFDALGDLIHTGPTGTNVGDLQVILLA